MGFLDIDLNDAVEPKASSAGEHLVRLVDLTKDIDKNGHPYLLARLDLPKEPTAKDFTQFLGLPYQGQDEKQANQAKWRLKSFSEAFGIDFGVINSADEVKGRTAWAILGVGETDEYGEQNYIKKYVKPA